MHIFDGLTSNWQINNDFDKFRLRGLHGWRIGGIFITGIFGNFYTKKRGGGIFYFQNGNSRWPWSVFKNRKLRQAGWTLFYLQLLILTIQIVYINNSMLDTGICKLYCRQITIHDLNKSLMQKACPIWTRSRGDYLEDYSGKYDSSVSMKIYTKSLLCMIIIKNTGRLQGQAGIAI